MAEGFCKSWLAKRFQVEPTEEGLREAGFQVSSCGLSHDYEPEGSPASAHGIDILRDSFGIDISFHRSHVASSPSEFLRQSHIFPLTSRHARIILEIAPSLRQSRKIVLEKLGDIEDPWHSRKEVYAACAAEIRECVFEKMEAHFG